MRQAKKSFGEVAYAAPHLSSLRPARNPTDAMDKKLRVRRLGSKCYKGEPSLALLPPLSPPGKRAAGRFEPLKGAACGANGTKTK